MKNITYEIKENIASGCVMGMILFISSVMVLGTSVPLEEIQLFISFLPAALILYLVLGIALNTFHHRNRKKKKKRYMFFTRVAEFPLFSFVFFIVLLIILRTVSYSIRLTVTVNIVTVVVIWFCEYIKTVKAAKEMNENSACIGAPSGRSLVEPLEERPENTEQFLAAITEYCRKNHIELEIITAERPAVVTLDGVYHLVSLVSLGWWFSGMVYCLKFEEMN